MAEMAQALTWGRDEAEVVTELQSGSPAAFDALIRHFHAPLFRMLCQMLGNPADAADTTQEVFLKAFRGIRGFRRGSSLKTWLYRIAIREALNQRRWWRRHQSKESSYDSDGAGSEALGATGEPSPFDACAAHEAQQTVRRALARLPQVFRSAVILRDLEGLSYEEIAEVLELSIGTVKSRILRGRRTLKELLEPELGTSLSGERHGGIMRRELAGGEP
ncbi:MAG TPA: sigma-70 family RNA polymerase sigma factor [Candidatus Acidoferrales bacterium]|nr:sigma-70 family RNA polymerase sigma factor [Candidatus Acidoferrales bacterium]